MIVPSRLAEVTISTNVKNSNGGSGHVRLVRVGGVKMSKFERLLVPGSTELPECRCGSEMEVVKSVAIGPDGELRTYRCHQCEHELRLTTWAST